MPNRILIFIVIFIVTSCGNDNKREYQDSETIQSLEILGRELIENPWNDRFINSIDEKIANDSIRLVFYSNWSLKLLGQDSLKFRKINREARLLSQQLDEREILANAYWDLGYFFNKNEILDSSYINYYTAQKLFQEIGNKALSGRMLLNMAILQEKVKDFVGSEISSIEALKIIPPNKLSQLYRLNNNLAVVNNGMEKYNEALDYHQKAENLAWKLDDSLLVARTFNNSGVVYQNKGDHEEALSSFYKGMDVTDLYKMNPELYAMLLDNISYSNLKLGKTNEFLENSLRALEIRDSLNHISGMIINKIHLGEYFIYQGDTNRAIIENKEAYDLSRKMGNKEYELKSLLNLANMTPVNKSTYFNRFIHINDSLLKEERMIRDKFAKIRFETDQYIQETETLSRQKMWIAIIGLITTAGLVLLYYFKQQQNKYKELQMEKSQQDSNEKIYNLLLNQQVKLEEGRHEERKRISEDLHDGILGRLFGTRMGIGYLKMDKDLSTKLSTYTKELQNIEMDIRNISHNLSTDISDSSASFINLIDQLVNEKNNISDIKFSLSIEKTIDFELIPNEFKINVYRIIQECLQNTIKHSQAKVAEVGLFQDEEFLIVSITDDGKGFDTTKQRKGIGLNNVKNRIEKLGGKMVIKSSTKGTNFIFKIPTQDYE